jgi:tetratricopeptide (TPR) repeat protein/predicted aspartyl protease
MGERLVRARHFGSMAALAAFSLSTAVAAARCQLQQLGVLPVDMQGLQPTIEAKLDGVDARFVLDTGAFFSTLSRDAAVQYQLPITPVPGDSFYMQGISGKEAAQVATAQAFTFLGIPLPKVQFFVVDENLWGNSIAGLIGQNLLRVWDTEYDLANGIVRFLKPVGCGDQPLAYWAVSTPYSVVELRYMDVVQPHLRATATLNGHRITVEFDTGSPRSVLSLQAAKRAGITPGGAGVKLLGVGAGIGPELVKMWVAPVETFQLGGEKVEHAHVLLADLGPARNETDMLLGDDFFLSHRIYVAYGQRKLYFTYNGGPLFNLNLPQMASAATQPATPPSGGAPAAAAPTPGSDTPTDADGFRRRGMAYAAMREFALALADLTRACELAPRDAADRYDRGVIYLEDHQLKPALADFDAAIALQPGNIGAHLMRAQLLNSQPGIDPAAGTAEVKSDLDAVSRLATPAADAHLTVGELYGRMGEYTAALDQIDQWLSYHRLTDDQAAGLNARCWLRATANRDLPAALDDCNRALALRPYVSDALETRTREPLGPQNPEILDSRGLVYLRLGRLKDAKRDYDAALHIDPNLATSLFGRGLAELRLGEKAQGEADLAAAEKLDDGIAKRFAGMGLAP